MNFESVETWVTVMILAFAVIVAWNPAVAAMQEIKTTVASAYTFVSPDASDSSNDVWDMLRGAATVMLYGFILVFLMWGYGRFQRKERVTGGYY